MKKVFMFAAMLGCALSAFADMFPIVACDNSFNQDILCQNAEQKWEEQVRYAMTSKTRGSAESLLLIDCEEKHQIVSNQELEDAIEQVFADDSYMVIQDPIDYSFVIKPINQISETSNDFTELKKELLTLGSEKLSSGKNLRLLELKWTYNDYVYLSRALVTDEDGILFETIGYLVLVKEEANNKGIKRMKTRGEYDNDDPFGDINNNPNNDSIKDPADDPANNPTLPSGSSVTRSFNKSTSDKNHFDIIIYSFNITCSSTFNPSGVLIDRITNATSYAAPGFQCSAQIQTISGTIGVDTYHEFAWGYQYGSNITINLSWNGMGFSVGGGGTSSTGSKIHRR